MRRNKGVCRHFVIESNQRAVLLLTQAEQINIGNLFVSHNSGNLKKPVVSQGNAVIPKLMRRAVCRDHVLQNIECQRNALQIVGIFSICENPHETVFRQRAGRLPVLAPVFKPVLCALVKGMFRIV